MPARCAVPLAVGFGPAIAWVVVATLRWRASLGPGRALALAAWLRRHWDEDAR